MGPVERPDAEPLPVDARLALAELTADVLRSDLAAVQAALAVAVAERDVAVAQIEELVSRLRAVEIATRPRP